MYTERQVVSGFLFSHGRLLLLKRSELVRAYRGRWTTINGSVYGDPLAKVIRLIEEETGLPSSAIELIKRGDPLFVSEKDKKIAWAVHPFLFRVVREEPLHLTWQHSEYRWVSPQALSGLETVPMLRETFRRVWDESLQGPGTPADPAAPQTTSTPRPMSLPDDPNLRRDKVEPRFEGHGKPGPPAAPGQKGNQQGIPVRVIRADAIPALAASVTSLETSDKRTRGKALLKDPVLQPKLHRLRDADARGQSVLIQRGLEALRLAADRSGAPSCGERLDDLRLVGRHIAGLRPASASLTYVVAQVLYELEFEMTRDPTVEHLLDTLDQVAVRLEEQYLADISQIADEIAGLIPAGGTIMTAGYHVPVLEALQRCHQFSVRVLVLDHQPTQDGRMMARAAAALGKSTTLVADGAMGLHVPEADLVVVGAETLVADGSAICDIGAYPLALVADAAGVPFYVAAPLSAVDLRPDGDQEIVLEEGDPNEIWEIPAEALSVRNVRHERVPPDYITGFITEEGYLKPSSVHQEVLSRDHLLEALMEE